MNKKGEVSETMTWVFATIIIIVITDSQTLSARSCKLNFMTLRIDNKNIFLNGWLKLVIFEARTDRSADLFSVHIRSEKITNFS